MQNETDKTQQNRIASDVEKMKLDLDYKTKDAELSLAKRKQEILGWLLEDIQKTVDTIARRHGFTTVVDSSKTNVTGGSNQLNITREVISEHNRLNPQTGLQCPSPLNSFLV